MMIHPLNSHTLFFPSLTEKQIQPNGVDLCVEKVFRRNEDTKTFVLSVQKNKCMSVWLEELPLMNGLALDPTCLLNGGEVGWQLTPGYYVVEMASTVRIGENEAGFVLPRSSLIRNGVTLYSGLYDSGYEGPMRHGLCVFDTTFVLEQGARIGQFILFKADALHQYDGQYQEKKQRENICK